MIPLDLKVARCCKAALSLPVMGREEMRRVPALPGPVAPEFSPQKPPRFSGEVMQLTSGMWGFQIEEEGRPYCGGAGFDSSADAIDEMMMILESVNEPI